MVCIVLIDDGDLPVRWLQLAPQPVDDHRPGGSAAEHQKPSHDNSALGGRCAAVPAAAVSTVRQTAVLTGAASATSTSAGVARVL